VWRQFRLEVERRIVGDPGIGVEPIPRVQYIEWLELVERF
jgi:hypothetical protein